MFEFEIKKIKQLTQKIFNQLEFVKLIDLYDEDLNAKYESVGYVFIKNTKILLVKNNNSLYKCGNFAIQNLKETKEMSLYGEIDKNSGYPVKSQELPVFNFTINLRNYEARITDNQIKEFTNEEIEQFKTNFLKRIDLINSFKNKCLENHIFL